MRVRQAALPPFARPAPLRSRNMAAIISKGNRTTERRLRALLAGAGVRGWRLYGMKEIGSPDFVFCDQKVAIFVHGCFWHGCPRCGHIPKTNASYWVAKLARNRRRDQLAIRAARKGGYAVLTIWECELRNRPDLCITRILRAIYRPR